MHANQTQPAMRTVGRSTGGRFGLYDVVAPLARGGTATVYLATHRTTGEQVALKVLEPQLAGNVELICRLFAEHALASRIRHANVVEIRASRFGSDGVPFLVMEYFEGESLAELADRGLMPLPTIVAICAQVASGVAAMHAAGVIHCDVKHDNVLVLEEPVAGWPRVKVIDFGVSRSIHEPAIEGEPIAGTPWCMAPEQWRGAPGPASDVYALGCMLYELTTGSPPFDGSLPELMNAHLEQRPSRPSWLRPMPVELERLVMRALSKDPAARPRMLAVANELSVLLDALVASPPSARAG